jgi:hypothetical protein
MTLSRRPRRVLALHRDESPDPTSRRQHSSKSEGNAKSQHRRHAPFDVYENKRRKFAESMQNAKSHFLKGGAKGRSELNNLVRAKKEGPTQSRNDRGVAASPPRGSALLCISTEPVAKGEQTRWQTFSASQLGGFRQRQQGMQHGYWLAYDGRSSKSELSIVGS